jgi:hypothetical protein
MLFLVLQRSSGASGLLFFCHVLQQSFQFFHLFPVTGQSPWRWSCIMRSKVLAASPAVLLHLSDGISPLFVSGVGAGALPPNIF